MADYSRLLKPREYAQHASHAKKRGKLFRREPLLRCVAARTNFRRKRC
jgi:hypothetical protein